jgi:hypothetical protein
MREGPIWSAAPEVHIVSEAVADDGDIVIVRQTVSSTDAAGRKTDSVRWVTRTLRDGLISRVDVFDSQETALEAARLSE